MASRRQFLGMAGAALLDGGPVRAEAAAPGRPADVGRKFDADGRVRPFAGNTILWHLPQQGPDAAAFDAILDIYREVPSLGFARKIACTPPSSYHVTLFVGANDQDRVPGRWPDGIPLDAPMERCHRLLGDRLRQIRLDQAPPFLFRVDMKDPAPDAGPITIRLLPRDEAEDRRLRTLRDRLSQVLGIRHADHDAYFFHVTVAYQIDWLTAEQQAEHLAALRRWKDTIARRSPVIALGAPEYCTLEDMFAFHRQFHLPPES
jgi:hypothetical protein